MALASSQPVDINDLLLQHNSDGSHKGVSNIKNGLAANRPSTCVKGDIYLSTDAGVPPNTGVLNICFATNVWTEFSYGQGSLNFYPSIADGRLTASSGNPVPAADVSAAATIYYTPYTGSSISLYNGSSWNLYSFVELSVAVPADSAGKVYDVFAYVNAGAVALEILAWASTTARATALTRQNGIWCKLGNTTRRYLGSFYSSTNSQVDDTKIARHVYNAYNRAPRTLEYKETADSWTYAVAATWRQWRGVVGAQFNVLVGLPGETVFEGGMILLVLQGAGGASAVAFGINSTSAATLGINGPNLTASARQNLRADLRTALGIGLNTIYALEYNSSATAYTAYGDNGGTYFNSGMTGSAMM